MKIGAFSPCGNARVFPCIEKLIMNPTKEKYFVMHLRLLSPRELDAIEERHKKGRLKPDDVERLIYSVRRLRENMARLKKVGAETVEDKSEGGSREKALSERGVRAKVFTDGACRGNPGPGGWGAILRVQGRERELSGGAPYTTNNRMEMTAVIEALKALPEGSDVVLTTDSQYVQKGITQWIKNWKRNGWKNAAGEPVKNADLWWELDRLSQRHSMKWHWVRGHSGHRENERCDELARKEIAKNSARSIQPGSYPENPV